MAKLRDLVFGERGAALALTLVYKIGWLNVFWISLAFLVFWSGVACVLARRNRLLSGGNDV